LAVACQYLILHYGLKYSEKLGIGFKMFQICSSGSMIASFSLLLSYLVSKTAYNKIRSSFLEVLLNLLCAALYITASAFLSFSVFDELIYEYETEKIPAYPAMKSVYIMGFIAGIIHLVDAIMAIMIPIDQN